MSSFSYNRVEIDLAVLQDNFRSIQETVGAGVQLMAIVKSDAYGHGLVRAAQSLYAAGARTFGVAEVEEGVALRQAGLAGEIVVLLGPAPETYDAIIRHRLEPVVFDHDTLVGLAARAKEAGREVGVHVKVDVGMGRLGFMPEEAVPFCRMLAKLPGVYPAGVLSHLPMAEDPVSGATARQLHLFREVLARLQQYTAGRPLAHIANSAALLNNYGTHLDMVRPGITLYGCYPAGMDSTNSPLRLRPVMGFKTRVVQVKEVPAGYGISYGHIFVTQRKSRLAVLPVGYADGYLRRLSNRAQVLIHGQRAPVCGRVCMNACMIDITDLADPATVAVGDEVVLMGRQQQEEITAMEMADWLETISYEVFCLIGGSNQRVYIEAGPPAG
jgi:alanine racemase